MKPLRDYVRYKNRYASLQSMIFKIHGLRNNLKKHNLNSPLVINPNMLNRIRSIILSIVGLTSYFIEYKNI